MTAQQKDRNTHKIIADITFWVMALFVAGLVERTIVGHGELEDGTVKVSMSFK